MRVPLPGTEAIVSSPPISRARLRMLGRPLPPVPFLLEGNDRLESHAVILHDQLHAACCTSK